MAVARSPPVWRPHPIDCRFPVVPDARAWRQPLPREPAHPLCARGLRQVRALRACRRIGVFQHPPGCLRCRRRPRRVRARSPAHRALPEHCEPAQLREAARLRHHSGEVSPRQRAVVGLAHRPAAHHSAWGSHVTALRPVAARGAPPGRHWPGAARQSPARKSCHGSSACGRKENAPRQRLLRERAHCRRRGAGFSVQQRPPTGRCE